MIQIHNLCVCLYLSVSVCTCLYFMTEDWTEQFLQPSSVKIHTTIFCARITPEANGH
jgi:hypothetical protein